MKKIIVMIMLSMNILIVLSLLGIYIYTATAAYWPFAIALLITLPFHSMIIIITLIHVFQLFIKKTKSERIEMILSVTPFTFLVNLICIALTFITIWMN